MTWTDSYFGIPFAWDGRDRSGCDCWGLVRLIYQEQLGVQLPAYSEVPTNERLAVLAMMNRQSRGSEWAQVPVQTMKAFDVVRMDGLYRDSKGVTRKGPIHVAVAIDGDNIIHIEHGIEVTALPIADQRIARRIVAVHRHETQL